MNSLRPQSLKIPRHRSNRMKIPLLSLVSLLLVLHPASPVLAQGPLTPPGAPAPTMKSLDQLDAKLEKRTPISSVPITISTPGSYYLTGNLTVATGNAITVTVDQVTIDLNGFTISSTASPASGTAVLLSGARQDVTIRNGHIRGTTTFSAGAFTPGGFLDGVVNNSAFSANLRVSDLSVSGMASDGIVLGAVEPGMAVERCSVAICGAIGIQSALTRDSNADTTGNTAIVGKIISNCIGETVNTVVASAAAINASSSADNCTGVAVSGVGVSAVNAHNCHGTSSSGNGLVASNASNCSGTSTSGAAGIDANPGTASFCRGQRVSGIAIDAGIAIGCTVVSGTVNSANKFLGTP